MFPRNTLHRPFSRVFCCGLAVLSMAALPPVARGGASDVTIKVVRKDDGAPVPNAAIYVGLYNTLPDLTVGKTDAKGMFAGNADMFRSKHVSGGVEWQEEPAFVWVSCQGYAPACIEASKLSEGQCVIRLSLGRRVQGRLLGRDKIAASGQPVLLVGNIDTWPVQYATKTDGQGNFVWNEAPEGDILLLCGFDNANPQPDICPIFQRLVSGNSPAINPIITNLPPVTVKPTRKYFYAACRDGQPVLPSPLITAAQLGVQMEQAFSVDVEPAQHCVVSLSEDQKSVQFIVYRRQNGGCKGG